MRANSTRRLCLLALASLALLGVSGCNILGPIFLIVEGPPKREAVFELDDERTTIVFIDDRNSRMPRRSLRYQMAEAAESLLLEKRVMDEESLLASRAAMQIALTESSESPMSIADIGRSVGAEVVVYVTIDTFALSPDGVTLAPIVQARVKVIDTVANERLWPLGEMESGYPLTMRYTTRVGDLPKTRAERNRAENSTASSFGMRIAFMFFTHETLEETNRGLPG